MATETRTGSFDHIRKAKRSRIAHRVWETISDISFVVFLLTWDFFSGVRDSVSHTARPDGVSHTDDPPVLMDLPENKSTVP